MARTARKSSSKKLPIPSAIDPMLCTLRREPFDDPEFLFEIKWDGYRIISYVQAGKVRLDSRSALDYTGKYPPVVQALRQLKRNVVLDGEMIVFNTQGMPDFDALQKYNGHHTPIPRLNPAVFTIDTIGKRLRKKGDLFDGILHPKTARSNVKILQKLS